MCAASHGHDACVRVLIAAQADVAYADSDGRTALHYAAHNDCASTCRVLIDEGASLTAVSCYGETPLDEAKEFSKAKCVAVLEAAAAAVQ